MADHVLKNFDNELDKLRRRIVKMGTLVHEQLKCIAASLASGEAETLKDVKSAEDKIDLLDMKIDKQCMKILALHQPVASDLRFVMSALSMNDNLELIGDAAMSVAYVLERTPLAPLSIKKTKILFFAQMLEKMVNETIQSIVGNDADMARMIVEYDSQVIETVKENYFKTVGMMAIDNSYIESGSCIIDINRSFATIASLVVSLAQKVVFVVDATMVKHKLADITDKDIEAADQD